MQNEQRICQLKQLMKKLGLNGEIDLKLIGRALTHPSYLYEGGGNPEEHNQRLEFLGDAVIGLIIARYLYQQYPDRSEGELTRMRSAIVCESSLAWAAHELDLGAYLLLGKGEQQMGGAGRSSNLADCFEALFGALYLTIGLKEVKRLVLTILQEKINSAAAGKYGDYKTQLQEYIQRSPNNRINYRILQESGPDHFKNFVAAVYLNEEELARGTGRTKNDAEQQAARDALSKFEVGS